MLGIHVSEGTTEGWFGPGRKSAIGSIAVLAALILGIAFGIYAAVNAGEETGIKPNAAPAAPAVSTPVEPVVTPGTDPVVGPSGVIEITAERLVRDLMANPNKYQRGTIFQVSGTLIRGGILSNYYLDPKVKTSSGKGFYVSISLGPGPVDEQDRKLLGTLKELNDGDQVVVRGTYSKWNPNDWQGVDLENVSLISATPAK